MFECYNKSLSVYYDFEQSRIGYKVCCFAKKYFFTAPIPKDVKEATDQLLNAIHLYTNLKTCVSYAPDICPPVNLKIKDTKIALGLFLNYKCNIKCKFCWINRLYPSLRTNKAILSKGAHLEDLFLTAIRNIANNSNLELMLSVNLVGESIISNTVINFLKKPTKCLHIHITTNGLALTKAISDLIGNWPKASIGCSIYSLDKTEFETIEKGANYNKVINNVRYASDKRINISILVLINAARLTKNPSELLDPFYKKFPYEILGLNFDFGEIGQIYDSTDALILIKNFVNYVENRNQAVWEKRIQLGIK